MKKCYQVSFLERISMERREKIPFSLLSGVWALFAWERARSLRRTLLKSLKWGFIGCAWYITAGIGEDEKGQTLAQNLKTLLQARLTLSGDFDVILQDAPQALPTDAQINEVEVAENQQSFRARLHFSSKEGQANSYIIRGKIQPLSEIPVLARALTPGEEIRAQDITWQKLPSARLSQNFYLTQEEIIGKTPRHKVLQPHQPLSRSDLKVPLVVKKGDILTIRYETPGLVLNTQAQAMQDGGKGDNIRVIPLQSKKEVIAKISGPGQGTVSPLDMS